MIYSLIEVLSNDFNNSKGKNIMFIKNVTLYKGLPSTILIAEPEKTIQCSIKVTDKNPDSFNQCLAIATLHSIQTSDTCNCDYAFTNDIPHRFKIKDGDYITIEALKDNIECIVEGEISYTVEDYEQGQG